MTAETELTRVTIYDYQYTTRQRQQPYTNGYPLVAMESTSLQFSSVSLSPEGSVDRIGSKFGFQYIDFDERPTFS
ncbi:hypothetical protein Poly59_00180 [Rubripirellula reticaptiva]|uniref:Uncharacterized protein n=1 Tax=Rubripirellula reticaptiva TaxID=2528013 RepID=A0A5C6F5Y9_9BACT|nr:hypothetical protein Poly59_00180 [Rubripirellula reticaptiva]